MATQKSVGVMVGEHSRSDSSGDSSSHESGHSTNPHTQPDTPSSEASSHRPSEPTSPQIPNQSLLVSGTKFPRLPVFNAVSTGSPASDRRATTVPQKSATKKITRTVGVPWGRLPQTGEVAVGCSVFLGVLLLVALGVHAYRGLRRD